MISTMRCILILRIDLNSPERNIMSEQEAASAPAATPKNKPAPKDNKGQGKSKPKENKKGGKQAGAKKTATAKKVAAKVASAKAPRKAKAAGKVVGIGRPGGSTNRGIGEFIRGMLGKEPDVNKVLEAVLKKFPGARTTTNSIYWYRSQMNKS